MSATAPSSSAQPISDAMVVPRVGIAVFVINEKGHVLVGKRTGSHGAGTLALPGGHLELHESFYDCAARETYEETGLILEPPQTLPPSQLLSSSPSQARLQPQEHFQPLSEQPNATLSTAQSPTTAQPRNVTPTPLQFVTAQNSVYMKDHGEKGDGKHYVTIFMKASVKFDPNQPVATARIMEPTKCLGWFWVPVSYLRNTADRQHQLQLFQLAAASEGRSLPVSIDKLLEAESLAQALQEADETDPDASLHSPIPTAALQSKTHIGSSGDNLSAQEALAWAEADDFARGAPLFQPLVNVFIDNPALLAA